MNIISINRVLLFIIIFNINQVFGQHFNQIGLFVGYVGSYQNNTNFYKALGLTDMSTCRLNIYSIGSDQILLLNFIKILIPSYKLKIRRKESKLGICLMSINISQREL